MQHMAGVGGIKLEFFKNMGDKAVDWLVRMFKITIAYDMVREK